MAKTKISELEKKYGADKKDIIAFLNEKGIDAKTASSSIDEDAAALVAARFGGEKKAPQAADASSSKSPEARPAAREAQAPAAAEGVRAVPVKKKKKIIIVTSNNQGGSRSGNAYTGGSQGGRSQAGQQSPARRQDRRPERPAAPASQTYHPIKPKIVPSQMTVDYHKPDPNAAAKAAAARAAAAQAEAKAAEEAAKAKAAEEAARAEVARAEAAKAAEEAAALLKAQEAAKAAEEAARAAEEAAKAAKAAEEAARAEEAAQAARPRQGAPKGQPAQQGQGRVRMNDGRPAQQGQAARPRQDGARRDPSQGRVRMNDNRQGQQGQGGFARGGASGQGRFGQQGQGGFSRGGAAGQGRFGQQGQGNFARGGAPAPGGRKGASSGRTEAVEAFGNNENKRRANQAKDRKGKKDNAFVMDDQKERRSRAGRFIKPVVEKKEEPADLIKVITIPEKLTIGDLAEAMHLKAADLIKKLFLAGKMMTVNSELSYEDAEEIAADYDILCEKEEKVDVIEELLREEEEDEKDMVQRPPVICVMGHVDHGKTSILDYIRKTKVTEKEAGGITQAIGAYTVKVQDRTITFLDTPGHEAFTAMRLRGAQSTDIAVLVVAADDGVMPQTVEAINHAKAAGVEIIVAVNKIDKPGANPDRVKEQLSKYELIPTDWGGQTEFVSVSAKTGEGIDDLLETILLQADVMELKANPDRLARGLVLEARLDKGRGPVANVLVQKGTLHVGDFISAGAASGKVRALINDKGKNVREAGPSTPLMVLGLSEVPSAGEVFLAHENNDSAKQYAATYKAQHKEELVEENRMSMNMEDLFDQMREGKMKELNLIVKADVQGSVEALCASLLKLSNDEVVVKIIHSAAGNITESDVTLAQASNAAIIGFNVHPDATAKSIAEHGGVSIHLYKVIYQAIDDVDAALKGMLAPVYEEKVIGHAEVRMIFKSGKIGNIAGSYVLDGVIEKGCSIRITRDGEQIYEGTLASLKRFKDDVKEVKAGYECGLVFEDFDSMNVGDTVEAYKMVEVPREQVIAQKEKEAQNKK